MKFLIYECKKLLDIKLLLLLALFTFLFYSMFMRITIHPEDSASCEAQEDLASFLREDYGTGLDFEEFGVLEELRQTQIEALDEMVRESSILQEADITTYDQLRDYAEEDATLREEESRIMFEDGMRHVFLKQEIESVYEMVERLPIYGVELGKEAESADQFLRGRYGGNYTKDAVMRVAEVIGENHMTLLPRTILFHLERDFPRFGILLIISCLILILPYQIKERLSGVNALCVTTKTGRGIWRKRYGAALFSCLLVCLVQATAFCFVLHRSGALQYWNYPVNGNSTYFYWFDMTFGMYLALKIALYVFLCLCMTAVFFLVSRMSSNYVVGVAIGAPITALFGVLTVGFTGYFLAVTRGIGYNLLRPIGFAVVLFCVAVVILYVMNKNDKRKDILV